MTLNPRQTLFCHEYMIDKNVTRAACAAGYSKKTAHATGSRLLKNVKIKEFINARLKKHADNLEITAERVLEEIATMAFYDVGELACVDIDGKIEALRKPEDILLLPKHLRKAIRGWKFDKEGNFIVLLADRSKALDQLARHLSLYNDTVNVNGLDALAERLERAHRAAT